MALKSSKARGQPKPSLPEAAEPLSRLVSTGRVIRAEAGAGMPEGRWNAVSSPRRLPGLPVLCCPFCRHGQLSSASRPLEPPCAVWLTRLLGYSSPGTCVLKPPQHRPMNSTAASGRRVLAGIQKATHWHPSSIQVNLPGKAWTSPPLPLELV